MLALQNLCGAWITFACTVLREGVVLTGIFACPELSPSEVPGLVYSGNFRGLGIQLLGLLVIVVYVVAWSM